VLIDIATGVRPAARLEQMITEMWLQLAEVIIHDGLLIPAAETRVRLAASRKVPYSRNWAH
jgi:hypothetical protein